MSSLVTILCSRMKQESSSSDEEHAAARPSSAPLMPLLSNVSYKKTLRLTSEQLVSSSVLPWPVRGPGLVVSPAKA